MSLWVKDHMSCLLFQLESATYVIRDLMTVGEKRRRRISVVSSQNLQKALSSPGEISCYEECLPCARCSVGFGYVVSNAATIVLASESLIQKSNCVPPSNLLFHCEEKGACGVPSDCSFPSSFLGKSGVCCFPAVGPFIARFFPAWDLTVKDSKSFTKACSSISSHQNEIRSQVFTQSRKCKGPENFPMGT